MTEEMKKADRTYHWQDGLPTGPDVDALMKAWPDMQVGDRVTYAEVGAVIGVYWPSVRFRTVTTAWRKRMLDKRIVLNCQDGEAFYAATPDQLLGGTSSVIDRIKASAKRYRGKIATIEPTTEHQRTLQTHHGRLLHEVERQAKQTRVNLLPQTEIRAAPRIAPPAQQRQGEAA